LRILYLTLSLLLAITSPIAGICIILIAVLCAPPFRAFVEKTIKVEVPLKFTLVASVLLFFASTAFLVIEGNRDLEQKKLKEEAMLAKKMKVEQRKADKLAEFNAEKDSILAAVAGALEIGDLGKAQSLSGKYVFSGDDDLMILHEKVKAAQFAKRKTVETKEILAELKTIPASDASKNRMLYQRLVNFHPDNEQYKAKFDKYNEASRLQRNKKDKALADERNRARVFLTIHGEKPEQRSWDGSYRVVTDYLKSAANDPSSIDVEGCTEVYKGQSGWLVGCDFRGKNAFGALVKNSNWFTVSQGRVLKVESADSFKPK